MKDPYIYIYIYKEKNITYYQNKNIRNGYFKKKLPKIKKVNFLIVYSLMRYHILVPYKSVTLTTNQGWILWGGVRGCTPPNIFLAAPQ